MEPYIFQGVVLPERAALTIPQFGLRFQHLGSGANEEMTVSVMLNQVIVRVQGMHEWDVFDLRNVVKNVVESHLAMIGYLTGLAYEFQVVRVINDARNIDYVFGIETPCIAARAASVDLMSEILKLREKTTGPLGVYITRCFGDLVSAMKHADDTAFYCYRAIESLVRHRAAMEILSPDKKTQWVRFRDVTKSDEQSIREIKEAADPLRHGGLRAITSDGRAALLNGAWDIVGRYLALTDF